MGGRLCGTVAGGGAVTYTDSGISKRVAGGEKYFLGLWRGWIRHNTRNKRGTVSIPYRCIARIGVTRRQQQCLQTRVFIQQMPASRVVPHAHSIQRCACNKMMNDVGCKGIMQRNCKRRFPRDPACYITPSIPHTRLQHHQQRIPQIRPLPIPAIHIIDLCDILGWNL